jgi:RHS repeat-associated protein
MYDVQLGRWMVVDPLSEKYTPITPYYYVGNNPITRIDPDGKK